jgi:hypothetical protein
MGSTKDYFATWLFGFYQVNSFNHVNQSECHGGDTHHVKLILIKILRKLLVCDLSWLTIKHFHIMSASAVFANHGGKGEGA